MALDIRLDFISNINPASVLEMTILREKFIKLDEHLKVIADTLDAMKKRSGLRSIALARTHLETGLQYAIKSLCIMGEQE
jgi:hypothetical protein